MSRREVYATSGARPTILFFAGADLPEDLTLTGNFEAADANSVPTGGTRNADTRLLRLFVRET